MSLKFNIILLHFQMLLALAGWVTGYNGEFPFDKPGDLYGEHRYVGMRAVNQPSILILTLHG